MKLGNFFVGNVFTISQSPHGALQGGKAIDAVPTSGNRLVAPCDMEIYYRKNDLGHQSYSYARGDGWKIIFVHAIIEKSGFVKRGEDIGHLASGGALHLHTAIEVNGAWDVVLNYMDRTVQLALTTGFSSQHWKSWSSWKNLNLGNNTMGLITDSDLAVMRKLVDKFNGSVFVKLTTKEELTNWWLHSGIFETLGYVETLEARIKQLELVNKTNADTIAKLNASIGGLTTDRNKYADMAKELKNKLDGITSENERLKIELEDTKKALSDCELKKDTCENAMDNVQEKIDGLTDEVEQLKGANQSLIAINKHLEEKLKESESNHQGITVAELLKKVINAIRNIFTERR